MIKAASSAPPAVKPSWTKAPLLGEEQSRRRKQVLPEEFWQTMELHRRQLDEAIEASKSVSDMLSSTSRSAIPPSPPAPPPVATRPAGDDNGGMETRVSKLEDFAIETRERLARVETKLDHINTEVSNFKWWVIAQIVAGLLAVLGTGIAIQQMTVASFQGAAQVAKDAAPAAPAQPPIIITVPQGYERGNGTPALPAKP